MVAWFTVSWWKWLFVLTNIGLPFGHTKTSTQLQKKSRFGPTQDSCHTVTIYSHNRQSQQTVKTDSHIKQSNYTLKTYHYMFLSHPTVPHTVTCTLTLTVTCVPIPYCHIWQTPLKNTPDSHSSFLHQAVTLDSHSYQMCLSYLTLSSTVKCPFIPENNT